MAKVIPYTKTYCLVVLLIFVFPYCLSAQGRDITWLRDVYHNSNTSLDGTMQLLSDSYLPLNAAVPAGQLLVGYIRHDKKTIRNGWQTAGSLIISVAITQSSKYIINRPRPYETYPDIIPYKYDKDPSMPSGHTSTCFATATALSLEYPEWYVIAPSYLYACAVAYSRMHLGEHYPSDVVVGALVGAGSSYLAHIGMKCLQHRKQKTKDTVHER